MVASFIIFFYQHSTPCILIIYFHSTSSSLLCVLFTTSFRLASHLISPWVPLILVLSLLFSPLPGVLLISPFFAYLAYLTACLFIYALISLSQPRPASIFSINRGFFHRVLWSQDLPPYPPSLCTKPPRPRFFRPYRGVSHRSLHASASEIRKIFAAKREINCTQMIAGILCKTKWSLVPWDI